MGIEIRDAGSDEWPGIWAVMGPIVAAGETYCYDRDLDEAGARARWWRDRPGRTFVAVHEGRVVGTAESHPNQGGGGAHVANAGFMVDVEHQGQGIGKALCAHVIEAARRDGFKAMQFNAVVETNTGAVALWRSFGFQILATVPEAFCHPTAGYVGLHVMYRRL